MEDTKSIPLTVFKQELHSTTAETTQYTGAISDSTTYIKQESDIKTEDVTTHTYQAASCSSNKQDTTIKVEVDNKKEDINRIIRYKSSGCLLSLSFGRLQRAW